MTEETSSMEIWIGLVEVRPLGGCELLDNARGAFINIVAWAASSDEYTSKVESSSAELSLFVVEITMLEPVGSRRERVGDLSEEIEGVISRSLDHPDEIVFGTFHTYKRDDA